MAAPCSLLCSGMADAKVGKNTQLEVTTGGGWVVLMVWQLPGGLSKRSQLDPACFLHS